MDRVAIALAGLGEEGRAGDAVRPALAEGDREDLGVIVEGLFNAAALAAS